MSAKLGLAALLVLAFAVDAPASGPRFTGRVRLVRGGTSIYRRALQGNQSQMTQQMKLMEKMAEQEHADAVAAAKRQREIEEAGAAANREIKQREQERGERERKRNADLLGASSTSSRVSKPATVPPKREKPASEEPTVAKDKPAKK